MASLFYVWYYHTPRFVVFMTYICYSGPVLNRQVTLTIPTHSAASICGIISLVIFSIPLSNTLNNIPVPCTRMLDPL